MMKPAIRKFFFLLSFISLYTFTPAQGKPLSNEERIKTSVTKPYKVLTNNKQITIQSKQIIRSVMVWTSSGHRVLEQKDVNAVTYTFTIPVKENIFFMMLQTNDGKRYTEKIGVQ